MIVRDSSRTVSDCLASIAPWVDELVVVDTGSTDNTPDIAQSHGARLFEFPWCDDFAAARNESLRHASGEWVFWMDSDDTIDEANGQKLRKLISADPESAPSPTSCRFTARELTGAATAPLWITSSCFVICLGCGSKDGSTSKCSRRFADWEAKSDGATCLSFTPVLIIRPKASGESKSVTYVSWTSS
jgi:glycosyltransferase involved in cell wall biosynthesis